MLGFAQSTYTFGEDVGGLDDEVFIIKKDDMLSEQDLTVLLQAVANTATAGVALS